MKRYKRHFTTSRFLCLMLLICVPLLMVLSGKQQAASAKVTITEVSDFQSLLQASGNIPRQFPSSNSSVAER